MYLVNTNYVFLDAVTSIAVIGRFVNSRSGSSVIDGFNGHSCVFRMSPQSAMFFHVLFARIVVYRSSFVFVCADILRVTTAIRSLTVWVQMFNMTFPLRRSRARAYSVCWLSPLIALPCFVPLRIQSIVSTCLIRFSAIHILPSKFVSFQRTSFFLSLISLIFLDPRRIFLLDFGRACFFHLCRSRSSKFGYSQISYIGRSRFYDLGRSCLLDFDRSGLSMSADDRHSVRDSSDDWSFCRDDAPAQPFRQSRTVNGDYGDGFAPSPSEVPPLSDLNF